MISKRKSPGPKPGTPAHNKGPEKRLVSARVEVEIHERLTKEAQDRKRAISAVVAEIITERYSPFPEDVE